MGKVLSKIAVCAALSAAASASSENVRALEDQIAHFKEIRQFWNDKIGNSEQKLAAERAILGDGDCKVGWPACPDGSECPKGYVKNQNDFCMCPSEKDPAVGAKREEYGKYAKCGTAPFSLGANQNGKCGVPAKIYAGVKLEDGYAKSADKNGVQAIAAVRDPEWFNGDQPFQKAAKQNADAIIEINVNKLPAGYKVCMFADGGGIHVVPTGGPSKEAFKFPLN